MKEMKKNQYDMEVLGLSKCNNSDVNMLRITQKQEEKIKYLVEKMTLKEKIGQMNQVSMSIVGGFDVPFEELIEMVTDGRISQEEFNEVMSKAQKDYHEQDIKEGLVGSMMVDSPEKANELQHIAVEESRLGIPLMFGLDVIHGYRSVYPIALAEACAFDEEMFEQTARIAAKESRTQGISWHFAPMLDISRDARWGRVSEGPGEDPYLASVFGKAKVRGLQNDHSSVENYVAACLKHFVAYGACESGRDYNTTSMSDSLLRNVYLPPFKAAVEEGAATVMTSFNDLNGMPCTVNAYTIREILKSEYGFKGLTVSDANAIRECITHGIAEDELDAAIQGVQAGLDIDMGTAIYVNQLEQAVKMHQVSLEAIDEAVTRILRVKMWLGLFDEPYVKEEAMHRYDTLPKEHLDLVRRAGEKSIVLLKNEEKLLPLKPQTRISLVGALANMPEEVVGAWAMQWRKEDCVSIREGLQNANADYRYFMCGGPNQDINDEEIKAAGEYGDVIVAVVGELVSMSGEAASRADITLPGRQREMLEKLLATNKPVIALLMNGRPLALDWEKENLSTIVECWHLGIQMGNAVANILFGKAVPEGKLSVTIPRAVGQCPIYYNHPNTGRPGGKSKYSSKYLDVDFTPAFPFGYGLSYTTFAYENFKAKETDQSVVLEVTVKNTGDTAGYETVQFYMQDITASIVRPVKELKGFKKVYLLPKQSKSVQFELLKKDMGFYNNRKQYCCENGRFHFYAGTNSSECLEKELNIVFKEGIQDGSI